MDRETKSDNFYFQQLDCYQVAREIAERVHRAKIAEAELRDQATRVASARPSPEANAQGACHPKGALTSAHIDVGGGAGGPPELSPLERRRVSSASERR
ncbi:MAG: hypothetical protein ACYCWW_17245 [Deltaproteobacteria bacterium]